MFIPRGLEANTADRGTRPSRVWARQLFDGVSLTALPNRVVELAAGLIVAIRPAEAADHEDPEVFAADVVAAGFIDLQINGAGGAQLNFDLSKTALDQIADGARQDGTAHILPTFVTAPGTDYLNVIAAAKAAIGLGVPGILGVHVEGPFLSPQRAGNHDPLSIRSLAADDIDAITAAFPGSLLLTLAPECLPEGSLEALARAGVTVFCRAQRGNNAGSGRGGKRWFGLSEQVLGVF